MSKGLGASPTTNTHHAPRNRQHRWWLSALLIALLASPIHAQEGTTRLVQIVNADSVAGVIEDGQRVRRLIGNVVLRQEETRLRAQRATQFLDFDITLFEGDVRIIEEGDTLTARLVRYNSASKTGEAEGNVRIADSTAVLFAPSATYDSRAKTSVFTDGARLVEDDATLTSRRGTYNSRTKVATFTDDVRLTDSTTVLTSRRGTYNTETRRADFAGDVRLEHPDTHLEADSLVHFRETQQSEAHGRVFIERFGDEEPDQEDADAAPDVAPVEAPGGRAPKGTDAEAAAQALAPSDSLGATTARDSTLRTLLFGDRALHDERLGFSRLDGQPLLVTLRTDSTGATDTLLVRARVLEAYRLDPASLDSMETAEAERRHVAEGLAAVDSVMVDSVAVSGEAVGRVSGDGLPVDSVLVGGESEDGAAVTGGEEDDPEEEALTSSEPDSEQGRGPPSEQGRGPPTSGLDEVALDSLRAQYGDDWQSVADSLLAENSTADPRPPTPYAPDLRPTTYDLPSGTEITRLVARDSVRIVQPDLVAVADSAVLDRFEIPPPEAVLPDALMADSLMDVSLSAGSQDAGTESSEPENRDVLRLFTRPSVWVDETQVTGAAMTVLARAETLDTLRVDGQAFAAQRDTSLAKVNQIRGRTMLALFDEEMQPDSTRENTLRELLVWPNAEAIYFRAKEQEEEDAPPLPPDSLLDGAVQVSADSIAFTFARDTLRAVRGYRGIEGLSYAADIVPANLQLGGYVYTPERRPTQSVLLVPGSREAVRLGLSDSLATPVFDIPDVDAARDSVGARLDSLDAERLRLDSLRQDSLRSLPIDLRPPPAELPTIQDDSAPPPSDSQGNGDAPSSNAMRSGWESKRHRAPTSFVERHLT
ncbi:MAG: OstA-like protein [Bacteroidota bacterium]